MIHLSSFSTAKSALLSLAIIGYSVTTIAAPQVIGIAGDVKHGDSLVISGTNFGELGSDVRTLWDSVENQPEWENLTHGAEVPTDRGPWTLNGNPWSQPVIIASDGDTRHAHSAASYQGAGKAYLGWPRAFANNTNQNLYVSWWFKPNSDLNEYGGHNKIIRIWDAPSGKSTRISWTQILLGAYGAEEPHYDAWGGDVGIWNRMEIFVNSAKGTIEAWANGKIVHSVDDYKKKDIEDGLAVKLVGFDPNYGERYVDLTFRMDDIYVSSELARVELSSSPTWRNTGKNKELQPFKKWSNNEITIDVNLGNISSEESLYLYIIDNKGNVNSEGFRLCGKCPNSPTLGLR